MSPTTEKWKDRPWAKRWMKRRSVIERRQAPGELINCDANCANCCAYDNPGCDTTDDDWEDIEATCPPERRIIGPAPPPSPAPAPPADTVAPAPETPAPETTAAETSAPATSTPATSAPEPTTAPTSASESTPPEDTTSASTPASSSASPTTSNESASETTSSVAQEWVFPAATGSIRARQAGTVDTAAFGPVYLEDSIVVQWTPEDTSPGIQWFCESDAGNRSGGLVSSNQSQPLQIQFNTLAEQADETDNVYCRLGFTDAPGQTVQWQYINTPNADGPDVISAPANVATAAVATATSLLSSATGTITSSPTSTNESNSEGGGGGLSTGAAAGIGVGVGLAVILAIILGVFCWRRRKNKGARRMPIWAAGGKHNSDDSSHPSYYSSAAVAQKQPDGIHELSGSPTTATELPAGLKGTAAMPSELYDPDRKKTIAELGSDKDFEEHHIRPRPLAPHPAQRADGEEEIPMHSPSDYGGTDNSTLRSGVSPASGTMNTGDFGMVSPLAMRKQSQQYSPVSDAVSDGSRETEPGWAAEMNRFQRKPVGRE